MNRLSTKKPATSPRSAKSASKRHISTNKGPKKAKKLLKSTKKSKYEKNDPLHTTKRQMAMLVDPLGQQYNAPSSSYRPRTTFLSPRSGGRPLTVILAGYTSFFAQHLFSRLAVNGFRVIPVSQEGTHTSANIHVHSMEYITENGLPDCDFVINCSQLNPWAKNWDVQAAAKVKIESNRIWADLIRESNSKPYAFLTTSSTSIYPTGTNQTFTDNFVLPGLNPYTHTAHERREFDIEHNITHLQALYRDAEHAARVFIPELDRRTASQKEEYAAMKKQYDHEDKKSQVHGYQEHPSSESRRLSVRKNLLSNQEVRVIPLRLGFMASMEMQEVRDFRTPLENGEFGPVKGKENNIVPWMWIDDAVDATLFSMITPHVKGPINLVTPQHNTTSGEFLSFIPKINRAFSRAMNQSDLFNMYGPERTPQFIENKIVVPSTLNRAGFKPGINTLDEAIARGVSNFEREIQYHRGIENLPRFGYQERR